MLETDRSWELDRILELDRKAFGDGMDWPRAANVTERERATAQAIAEWTARRWYLLNQDRVHPVELDDLEQEARIGAFRAEARFRREGPASFVIFAQRAALAAIRDYVDETLDWPRMVAEGRRPAQRWELPPLSLDTLVPEEPGLVARLSERIASPGTRPRPRTHGDLLDRVGPALGSLPSRQRTILFRKFWRRDSGSRIGRALHLPPARVRRDLQSALDRMRAKLQTPLDAMTTDASHSARRMVREGIVGEGMVGEGMVGEGMAREGMIRKGTVGEGNYK